MMLNVKDYYQCLCKKFSQILKDRTYDFTKQNLL